MIELMYINFFAFSIILNGYTTDCTYVIVFSSSSIELVTVIYVLIDN